MEEGAGLRKRNVGDDTSNGPPSASTSVPPVRSASSVAQSPPEFQEYGSADAYAQAVRTWLWAYQSWQFAQSMAPFHVHQALMSLHVQQRPLPTTQPQQGSSATPASGPTPPPTATPSTPGTAQHVVASYGRRLMAELIDFVLCFILKLVLVWFFVEYNFIDLDKYEKLLGDQPDLKTFIEVTQDLFPVEILNKVITSVIEAMYVSFGLGVIPKGCTPGKMMMGLQVIRCETCVAVAPRDHRVVLTGAGEVPFLWSLVRSTIKNFCLSFLFPICITMYAFRYNRSFYDITTGTIVIEKSHPPLNVNDRQRGNRLRRPF